MRMWSQVVKFPVWTDVLEADHMWSDPSGQMLEPGLNRALDFQGSQDEKFGNDSVIWDFLRSKKTFSSKEIWLLIESW